MKPRATATLQAWPTRTPALTPTSVSSTPSRASKLRKTPIVVCKLPAVLPPGLIFDHVIAEESVFCLCKGKGDRFHNLNVRCAPCGFCNKRIRGIYFNEHEGECWKGSR